MAVSCFLSTLTREMDSNKSTVENEQQNQEGKQVKHFKKTDDEQIYKVYVWWKKGRLKDVIS